MKSWLLPCLLATLAAPSLAQKNSIEAWAAFERDHGPDWTAEWSSATKTPYAIYGPGLSLPGRTANLDDARRRAELVLDKYSALLGRGASKFVEITGVKALRLYVFVYRQEFKGLEVIDGRADVRVHENGGISMFGAEAIPVPADFNVAPTLSAAAARAAARRLLKVPSLFAPGARKPATRLVIWSDVSKRVPVAPRLAWRVEVAASAEKVGKAFIDAQTGDLLEYESDILECCRRLRAELGLPEPKPAQPAQPAEPRIEVIPDPSSPSGATVDGTVLAYAIDSVFPDANLTLVPMAHLRIGSTFTDASGKFSLPGTSATVTIRFVGRHAGQVTASRGTTFSRTVTLTGSNNRIVIYTPTAVEDDRSQSTAYLYTTRCNLFMRTWIGNNSSLDRMNTFTSSVNVSGGCNAFYSNNGARYFQSRGTCPNMAYASVVQHEWGHGLDDSFGGLQRGECQEGMADTVAMMQNDDPVVGRKFFSPTRDLRTGLNTRTYPAGGGVHQQGETWMGWLWDCRLNFEASSNKQMAITLMRKLFANVFTTSPPTQPRAVLEVFMLDDDDNNLNNGVPHYADFEKACKKRRLPYPERKLCNFDAAFSTYGRGCPTASVACSVAVSKDWNQAINNNTTTATDIGIIEFGRPKINACGLELFTRSRSGNVTVTFGLARLNNQGEPGPFVASGTVTVGTTAQAYRANFAVPMLIDRDDTFIVMWNNADKIVLPEINSGADSFHWERRNNRWSQLLTNKKFRYRLYSDTGARVPILSNTDLPSVGASFSVDLSNAPLRRPGALYMGGSRTQWGPIRLPFSLSSVGGGNCSLLASGENILGYVSDGQGNSSFRIPVPVDKNLCSLKLYFQYMVVDQNANNLGLVFSNGGEAAIGN